MNDTTKNSPNLVAEFEIQPADLTHTKKFGHGLLPSRPILRTKSVRPSRSIGRTPSVRPRSVMKGLNIKVSK